MRRVLSSAAVLILSAVLPGHAIEDGMRLEAEGVFLSGTYGNVPGGNPIEPHACISSSGGYGVDGIDIGGEWIAWFVSFDEAVCFTDSLRSARTTGVEFDIEFSIGYSPYEIIESDTLHMPVGLGVG